MPAAGAVGRWLLQRAGAAVVDRLCAAIGLGAPPYPAAARSGRGSRADGYASRGEAVVAAKLRELLPDYPFRKVRPNWLRNPRTGQNLELDFYNGTLNIAVEVQGVQHYQYTPAFHRRGFRDFRSQCARDSVKRKLCRARGVALIEVPGWVTLLDEQLDGFLRAELDRALAPPPAAPSPRPTTLPPQPHPPTAQPPTAEKAPCPAPASPDPAAQTLTQTQS